MPATPDVTHGPHWSLPPGLSCAEHRHDAEVRVVVAGELDLATLPTVDVALRRAEEDAQLVVLDLSQLEFIDCRAVRMLVDADRRMRAAGRRLVIVRGSAEVDWLFALAGVDDQLEFVRRPPDRLGLDGGLGSVALPAAAWATSVRRPVELS